MELQEMLASKAAKVSFGDLFDSIVSMLSQKNTFPVVLPSSGLVQRTFPYAAPMAESFQDGLAAFNRVRQYNPIDTAVTNSVTGAGSFTLALPGAPGPATSADRSAFFSAVLLDIAKSANIAPAPVTIDMAGAYEDGSPYVLPSIEFGWAAGASDIEHVLILVAEETLRGPRMRTARLTTNDFPSQFNGNGAAAMIAGDVLTVNVTSAPAGAVVNGAIVNSQHYAYDLLSALFAERAHPEAPALRSSSARIGELVAPSRLSAFRNRIGGIAAK